ncbi:MAG TPA: hypothetical protein VMI54_04195 [Polyangiaceae bacterium]|nr:hypothetical protein [Polyangiaceae bacterium]
MKGKVPVTKRALIQRINRKIADDGEVLKATRGERSRQELGDFYILDPNHNAIVNKHVDPEALGRELGVLKPYETLVD